MTRRRTGRNAWAPLKTLWKSRKGAAAATVHLVAQRSITGLIPAATIYLASGSTASAAYSFLGPPLWALPLALGVGSVADALGAAQTYPESDWSRARSEISVLLVVVSAVSYAIAVTKGYPVDATPSLWSVGYLFVVLIPAWIWAGLIRLYSLPEKTPATSKRSTQ